MSQFEKLKESIANKVSIYGVRVDGVLLPSTISQTIHGAGERALAHLTGGAVTVHCGNPETCDCTVKILEHYFPKRSEVVRCEISAVETLDMTSKRG